MRLFLSLLFVLPSFAGSVVLNGNLMSQASADHLATWLGQGDLAFTNVLSIAGGTANGAATFHSTVDGIGPTFILMQTSLGLVGGYNPVSWSSPPGGAYTLNPTDAGRTAFLFDLVNPTVYRQRLGDPNGQYQTLNYILFGPAFGNDDLIINSTDLSNGYANAVSYGNGVGQTNVFGRPGRSFFTVTSVEAYTFAPAAVPEPASVALIALAFGGLALRQRSRAKAS